MTHPNETTPNEIDPNDVLETLEITQVERGTASGGAWVRGQIAGHRFDALVFSERADMPEFELDHSRISKLWVQRIAERTTVANFDRGWDVRPATPIAEVIVDLLTAGLAEHTFAN